MPWRFGGPSPSGRSVGFAWWRAFSFILASTMRSSFLSSAIDQSLELSAFGEVGDDVAAADELSVDVDLGNRRPARVLLDPVTDAGVGEHVDGVHLAQGLEQAERPGAEAARREQGVALHVEDDLVGTDLGVEAGLELWS